MRKKKAATQDEFCKILGPDDSPLPSYHPVKIAVETAIQHHFGCRRPGKTWEDCSFQERNSLMNALCSQLPQAQYCEGNYKAIELIKPAIAAYRRRKPQCVEGEEDAETKCRPKKRESGADDSSLKSDSDRKANKRPTKAQDVSMRMSDELRIEDDLPFNFGPEP